MTEKIEDWQKQIPIPITFPEPRYMDSLDLLYNTATGNTRVGTSDFDISDEPETWVESVAFFVWDILLNYGLHLAIAFCIYSLFGLIFKKLYLSGVVAYWKKSTGFIRTLEEMRTLLEADYDVKLWSEPSFCKQYLELYDAFRRFRSITNRDHLGNSIIDDRKRQEEAKPLYAFFDVDYELKDRLIYAFDGLEPQEESDEAENENSQQKEPEKSQGSASKSEGSKKRSNRQN